MNSRIALSDIAARLSSQLGPSVHVGTCYDVNYLQDFAKQWPAVWVAGQRLRPVARNMNYTGNARQEMSVEVVLRVVVQRYVQDGSSPEAQLNGLHDNAIAATHGWKTANARLPFELGETVDGPPHQSVMTADIILRTQTLYRSTT